MSFLSSDLDFPASLSDKDIDYLNEKYGPLDPETRIKTFYEDFGDEKVLLSSSFGTTAAILLKMISRIRPEQEVLFIDTGFLFPETLEYRDQLTELLDLKVVKIEPSPETLAFSKKHRLWETDPQLCTQTHKIEPFEKEKSKYKLWMSGVMAWQTSHRAAMKIFEKKGKLLKFHPLLDLSESDKNLFFIINNLPLHPLVARGYDSVGCVHCTQPGKDREGRFGLDEKKECGLHL